MKKPDDFWQGVARDVANEAHRGNHEVPAWDELDEKGQLMLVNFCILAVKWTSKHGRANLPAETVPDPKGAA